MTQCHRVLHFPSTGRMQLNIIYMIKFYHHSHSSTHFIVVIQKKYSYMYVVRFWEPKYHDFCVQGKYEVQSFMMFIILIVLCYQWASHCIGQIRRCCNHYVIVVLCRCLFPQFVDLALWKWNEIFLSKTGTRYKNVLMNSGLHWIMLYQIWLSRPIRGHLMNFNLVLTGNLPMTGLDIYL